jgi:hypothetical protein
MPFEEGIPDELKTCRSWVCYDNNEDKVPMVALKRGWRRASSTNPDTWRTYNEAVAALETGRYAGIGRVITPDDPFVGVDIDGCRDPESGQIDERGLKILSLLDSYSEVSPSSKGVKVWVRAELPQAFIKPRLEIYPKSRYFTVTGQFLSQFLTTLQERQEPLEVIIATEFSREKRPLHSSTYRGPTDRTLALDDVLKDGEVEVLAEIADGTAAVKYAVRCPWLREHTNGDESGTFVGQYASGALWFHCYHSHCSHRDWREFRYKVAPPCTIRLTRHVGTPEREAVIRRG